MQLKSHSKTERSSSLQSLFKNAAKYLRTNGIIILEYISEKDIEDYKYGEDNFISDNEFMTIKHSILNDKYTIEYICKECKFNVNTVAVNTAQLINISERNNLKNISTVSNCNCFKDKNFSSLLILKKL